MEDREYIQPIVGLCWATSRLNYHQFCAALGWTEDDWSLEKFQHIQEATRLLGHFDNHSLAVLAKEGLRR